MKNSFKHLKIEQCIISVLHNWEEASRWIHQMIWSDAEELTFFFCLESPSVGVVRRSLTFILLWYSCLRTYPLIFSSFFVSSIIAFLGSLDHHCYDVYCGSASPLSIWRIVLSSETWLSPETTRLGVQSYQTTVLADIIYELYYNIGRYFILEIIFSKMGSYYNRGRDFSLVFTHERH